MKRIIFTALLIPLFITSSIFSQNSFKYTIDLRDTSDDLFIVEFTPSKLTNGDSILSFVAFAPGAHQPLNFGRFVVSVSVNYKDGNVEQAFNKSTNDYVIEDPENVESITYLIKDSFDADVEGNSIHAMSGTGITKEFIIINNFGVLAYFAHRKDDPVTIELLLENNRTVGTALEESEPLKFDAESYYHAADSPILVGDLSKAGKNIDGIDVEVFVYSPTTDINAEKILELSDDVFPAASKFMGFQPVDRYVMLMYFFDLSDQSLSHLIQSSGALEHSYSSTYALPAMPQFLPRVKSIVSHEYMHILTPLHLRSEIIANWDYSKPTSEDDHLWLYEGVTDWVSYIMMLRSGSMNLETFLKNVSDKIQTGKMFDPEYSILRLSNEWMTDEGNKQYSNIYYLGSLTALCLDIKILELSGGKFGLREVYLDLINEYGKDNPFDNETFIDVVVGKTFPEIRSFFEDHIWDNKPLNYVEYLSKVGIKYFDKKLSEDSTPTFGISFHADGSEIVIRKLSDYHVDYGLKVGDKLKKIFGEEVTMQNFMPLLDRKKEMSAGDKFEIGVERNEEFIELEGSLFRKVEYDVFEEDKNADAETKRLRDIWQTNLSLN